MVTLAAVFFAFALQQITLLRANLWIQTWAYEFDKLRGTSEKAQGDPKSVNSTYYLAAYGLICLADVLVSFVRDLMTFSGALKVSA